MAAPPALTTTFTPAPDCTQVHLKGCGVLPYTTNDGSETSACTGAPFPTQECAAPNASCFPSSSDNGEPIVTYAGTICPVGMEALESGSDGIFCCASGYERFGDSYCTGTATAGTFVAHSTGSGSDCPITSTVEFAAESTGFFDFEYSTAGSTVTLPYALDRLVMEVTAQGVWLVPGDGSGGGDGSTSTPPPTSTPTSTPPAGTTDSSSSSYPTESPSYPTESPSSGYPTAPEPTDSPSGSMTPVPTNGGGSSYTAVPPASSTDGGDQPTGTTGYPTGTPPDSTESPSVPIGSGTPSPSSSTPPNAAGRMDTSLVTIGGMLFATLGYFIMQ